MFGKLIKEYRKITKSSQEEMAYKLGISSNHLSRIERHKTYPSGDLINRIIETIVKDIDIVSFNKPDSSLYGIIILIFFDKMNESQRYFIFNEIMSIVKLINNSKNR